MEEVKPWAWALDKAGDRRIFYYEKDAVGVQAVYMAEGVEATVVPLYPADGYVVRIKGLEAALLEALNEWEETTGLQSADIQAIDSPIIKKLRKVLKP